jgi:microsomal dipeptidase-like Zn-dependent dipeptidase
MERGFSDEDILKILGGNTLRVMREVEQVSLRLKAEAR